MSIPARVKFYDEARGFGFVVLLGGENVHLSRAQLPAGALLLRRGDAVLVQVSDPDPDPPHAANPAAAAAAADAADAGTAGAAGAADTAPLPPRRRQRRSVLRCELDNTARDGVGGGDGDGDDRDDGDDGDGVGTSAGAKRGAGGAGGGGKGAAGIKSIAEEVREAEEASVEATRVALDLMAWCSDEWESKAAGRGAAASAATEKGTMAAATTAAAATAAAATAAATTAEEGAPSEGKSEDASEDHSAGWGERDAAADGERLRRATDKLMSLAVHHAANRTFLRGALFSAVQVVERSSHLARFQTRPSRAVLGVFFEGLVGAAPALCVSSRQMETLRSMLDTSRILEHALHCRATLGCVDGVGGVGKETGEEEEAGENAVKRRRTGDNVERQAEIAAGVDGTTCDDDGADDDDGDDDVTLLQQHLPRLEKAERVIKNRTTRVVVILECVSNLSNCFGIFRSCEAFGVQEVWVVLPARYRTSKMPDGIDSVSKKTEQWLTVRYFASSRLAVAAARAEGRDIWVTHLHADNAVSLGGLKETDFPKRFALVIGAEHEGVSPAMLEASSKAVYLSMVGFVESLNVGVATALALQRILDLCPSMRGDVSVGEQLAMRSAFYRRLARNKTQARVFGRRAAVLNREAVLGGGQGGAEGTSM